MNDFDVRVSKHERTEHEYRLVPIRNANPHLPPGGGLEEVIESHTYQVYEAALPHQCEEWVIGRGTKEEVAQAINKLIEELSLAGLRLACDDLAEPHDEPHGAWCGHGYSS